jgi:hypothetical protein
MRDGAKIEAAIATHTPFSPYSAARHLWSLVDERPVVNACFPWFIYGPVTIS